MNITKFSIKNGEVSFSVQSSKGKRTSNNNDLSAFQSQLEILQDEMFQFTGNYCTLISFAIKTKTVKNADGEKIPVKVITTVFEEKRVTPTGKEYFQESRFVNEMISEEQEYNEITKNTVKQNVSVSVLNSELVFTEIIEKNLGAFFPTKTWTLEESEKAMVRDAKIINDFEEGKEQSFAQLGNKYPDGRFSKTFSDIGSVVNPKNE